MSVPHATTFQVKASNRLSSQSIYVKIREELQYRDEISSSSQKDNFTSNNQTQKDSFNKKSTKNYKKKK